MNRRKLLAILAPLVLMAVILGSGLGAPVSRANSAESAARSAPRVPLTITSSACPTGYRALTMTNHCSQDVWFAEDPSSAPGGTPKCSDPTNAKKHNFGCPVGTTCNSGGVCVTSCTDPGTVNAPDCGPNQTCFDGGFAQHTTGKTIYECFANYYEPTPIGTPTPSSGSGWDLAANGGQAVICVP